MQILALNQFEVSSCFSVINRVSSEPFKRRGEVNLNYFLIAHVIPTKIIMRFIGESPRGIQALEFTFFLNPKPAS